MIRSTALLTILAVVSPFVGGAPSAAKELLPIPDGLVVLTFDDGNKSDITRVAPLLTRYGFGATFFITEGLGFPEDKKTFLTWGEIRKLHGAGFEIGNHTRSHPNLTRLSKEQVLAELEHIEARCKEHGIPTPKTFCYPGWQHSREVVGVLLEKGYLFARRGSGPEFPEEQEGGPAYDPAEDHPLLVPTTGASGPNWGLEDLVRAVEQAREGKIAVLTFHGVPDTHPWVNTKPDDFTRYMKCLHDRGCTVIAMRDLAKYADPAKGPSDPYQPIERRLGVTPAELSCEYAVNPLGIDVAQPRFSWVLQSSRRGQVQSAYQILVAGNQNKLRADIGDKWDSGKVDSDRSVNVAYRGKALGSGEASWWKVRVWDKDGKASTYSTPARFEMGLLRQRDWQGKWIAMGDTDGPRYVPGRFGKAIELNGRGQTVRIPHHARLKPGDQITISAWIKPTECSDRWREVYRKDDGEARHLLAIAQDSGFYGLWCGFGIGGEYVERGTPLSRARLKDGRWHLVAVTYDGETIRFYADTKQIGSAAVGGKLDTEGTRPAYIGSLDGRSEFFPGGIDDVRVYDRALSAKEIQALAGNQTAAARGLVGWWKLDGDLTDAGGGKAGTAVGAETAPAPMFRRRFEIDKQIRRARAYVSGLGYYELYVNGRRVGDRVLDPAPTNFHNDQPYEMPSRVSYVTYDVTEYLKPGWNVLGVQLGNGWYSGVTPALGRQPYGDRPILLLQLNVDLADGRRMSVVTDPTWKTSGGPTLDNEICGGESYDARLEMPGWASAGYDDSGWQDVILPGPPSGVLVSQIMPPARVVKTFKPVKVLEPADGVYVYDFGQNMSGWSRLSVRGPRGTKVRLRHAPRVYEDGRLDTRAHGETTQTDTYILKGRGLEEWEPRFTLHGFRYVEMTGFPGQPSPENLEARFVRSALDLAGEFACSNRLINQIHHNVLWTFLCSLQGIPQDAAERAERVGWLGDTGFVWEDYIYNIDMAAFTTKWLGDIRDTQRPSGELAVTAPKWRRRGQQGPRYSPYPCWISTYPLLSWYMYEYYGDSRVLRAHYDGLKKMVAYKARHAPGHIFTHGLGDHMEPQADGNSSFRPRHTSPLLTSTAYYYYDVKLLARIARVLGHSDDARHYAKLAEEISQAFNKEFFDVTAGQYGTGSQTANALPRYFGMVPPSQQQAVVSRLARDITVNHQGHLSTGIIGTNALEQTLVEHGLAEVMYGIVTQTTFPSWGYQVRRGATTISETWEGEPSHSMNMKMFGSTEKFFYKDLAGIAPAAPGFRRITIRPRVVGDLTWVKASLGTAGGPVAVHWGKGKGSLAMHVTIPVNATAKVSVPTMGLNDVTITESGNQVWKDGSYAGGVPGITAGSETNDYVQFDVGSGLYSFKLSGTPKGDAQ